MDLQTLVGDTYQRLADSLESEPSEVWDRASLCAGWRVREVIAHVTMAARMTPEQFGAEIAAFGGDFQRLSDGVAARDSALPEEQHLANLRSAQLAVWQPPGGGAAGALNHAVVHALDVTNAIGLTRPCSDEAARATLDDLTRNKVAGRFGVELADVRLEADDLAWTWGEGATSCTAPSAELISALCHRTLPSNPALTAALA